MQKQYWYCDKCNTRYDFEIYADKQYCALCDEWFEWDWDVADSDTFSLDCWIRKDK